MHCSCRRSRDLLTFLDVHKLPKQCYFTEYHGKLEATTGGNDQQLQQLLPTLMLSKSLSEHPKTLQTMYQTKGANSNLEHCSWCVSHLTHSEMPFDVEWARMGCVKNCFEHARAVGRTINDRSPFDQLVFLRYPFWLINLLAITGFFPKIRSICAFIVLTASQRLGNILTWRLNCQNWTSRQL